MIRFDNVSMSYGPRDRLLRNINFNIRQNEFVYLMGKSGTGKSTVLRLVLKELSPDKGRIFVNNLDISKITNLKIPYYRRQIGMVFQDFRLLSDRTVYENVAFAMDVVGKSKRKIRRRVMELLNIVGLLDKTKSWPDELSGGEKQRVAIARACANYPPLILADEPTGNLDADTSQEILYYLDQINRMHVTVLMATHDIHVVERFKRRIIQIEAGRISKINTNAKEKQCSTFSNFY